MLLNFTRREIEQSIKFTFDRDQKKKLVLNDAPARVKSLVGRFNTVMFSPEDLMLIKGTPSLRRKFLDREIAEADAAYYDDLLKFNRILTQRNTLLKNIREGKANRDTITAWDEQFAHYAARIVSKRQLATEKLSDIAATMHGDITDGKELLHIDYVLHEIDKEPTAQVYADELLTRRQNDIARGSTGIGPQHDDLYFSLNGVSLKAYGSQGQQRTGVLSLKLAELRFLLSETGEYPVLLLDDIMSELDNARRSELLRFLLNQKIQTCITATDDEYFSAVGGIGKRFSVSSGIVQEAGH